MAKVVTRFAPSPTGFLHIGGARTALFNWLFARHHGGDFLLRIEDTDRARYTPEAVETIYESMKWLGLDWDGDAVSQFVGAQHHADIAKEMVARGTAYHCFSTQDEIAEFRERAKAEGTSTRFMSPWRDVAPSDHPDLPSVIRLKAPLEGATTIEDAVQGTVTWKNETLDDLILTRSDGTPTYMLAVVVDDHDMGVTHVIRGDDHLTNAARQTLIYQGMEWEVPVWAHIPLIHGEDGKKLSKRHGAVGVEEYRDMGYPAEAMRNYLARLGWSHGDDEYFTTQQAIEWFSLDGVGKSASRFDFKKLGNLTQQHFKAMDDAKLTQLFCEFIATHKNEPLSEEQTEKLQSAMPLFKERAKSFVEMSDSAHFLLSERPFEPDEKASALLNSVSIGILNKLTSRLQHATWTHENIEETLREFAQDQSLKLGEVMQPLRAALTGRTVSPSVFNLMEILGRPESLARLEDAINRPQ